MSTIRAQTPSADQHSGFSYIQDGQSVTISQYKQMVIVGTIELAGSATLTLLGDLAVIF